MEIISKNIQNLPLHVLDIVIQFLDIRSITRFTSLSRTLFKLLNENLWKYLSIREHLYFLACDPYDETLIRFPRTLNDIEKIEDSLEEANKIITNPFDDPLTTEERETFEKNIANINNWRIFYIAHKLKPNYSGYFVGDYGAHGFELIRIYHKGYKIFAKKLSGDVNVPAGKLTWKATLDKNLEIGKGYIHLANVGFLNSRWSNCIVKVKDRNTFVISWFPGEYFPGLLFVCEFFNVRGGHEPAEDEDKLRKNYVIPLHAE